MPRELRTRAVNDIPPDPRSGSRRAPTGNPPGAPRKAYENKRSKSSRREDERQTYEQISPVPFQQAVNGFLMLLRETGNDKMERICKKVLRGDWDPDMVEERVKRPNPAVNPLTTLNGLQLLMDCDLSKEHYKVISQTVNACGIRIMPSYQRVALMKEDGRPTRGIEIGEREGRVELQPLLEKTLERAVLSKTEQIDQQFGTSTRKNCTFMCTVGFDSSTGHSLWHQKFQDEQDLNEVERPDNSVIFACLNPLKLVSDDDGSVLWENPAPCSNRLVRPIMIRFEKETADFTTRFHDQLKDEIGSLTELRTTTEANNLIVARPQIFFTMIDQKVLNHITDTSSQCCPICGASPSEFMNRDNFDTETFQPYDDALNFGISPLHAWLNVFNHLLRLANHLPILQHRACGAENKRICKERKEEIQRNLFQEIGIKVGVPNANGSGNSNNGNCARRAFENPRQFARILGLDGDLVSELKAVLEHSWEVARNFPVPTGLLSEEGLEAKHKTHKKIRRDHCRKTSRRDAMYDLFFRSMDLSDPVLAMVAIERAAKYQRFHRIPDDARPYLILDEADPLIDDETGEIANEDDIHNAAFQAALEGQVNVINDELDEI